MAVWPGLVFGEAVTLDLDYPKLVLRSGREFTGATIKSFDTVKRTVTISGSRGGAVRMDTVQIELLPVETAQRVLSLVPQPAPKAPAAKGATRPVPAAPAAPAAQAAPAFDEAKCAADMCLAVARQHYSRVDDFGRLIPSESLSVGPVERRWDVDGAWHAFGSVGYQQTDEMGRRTGPAAQEFEITVVVKDRRASVLNFAVRRPEKHYAP